MEPDALGRLVIFGLGGAGGAWAAYQLWRATWGAKADKATVDDMKKALAETVTRDEFEKFESRTNDELERRRKGEIALHERIDDLKDAVNKGFLDTQRLILERLPK